jgi:hypothetical protein
MNYLCIFGLLLFIPFGVSQRLRPPDAITCPRNDLTSFTGKVLSYKRSPGRILLRMRTDESTTEKFVVNYPESDSPVKFFLMNGELFREENWTMIESSQGVLHSKMRATVWVCKGAANPTIDWRPPSD